MENRNYDTIKEQNTGENPRAGIERTYLMREKKSIQGEYRIN